MKQKGFARLYINGKTIRIDEWEEVMSKNNSQGNLKLTKNTSVDLGIDRLLVNPSEQNRLAETIESAFELGHGLLKIFLTDQGGKTLYFSESTT